MNALGLLRYSIRNNIDSSDVVDKVLKAGTFVK